MTDIMFLDSNGRFSPGEKGFVKIAEQKLDGKIFGGIYYAGERGKLNCRAAGIRYVKARKLDGRTLKAATIISAVMEEYVFTHISIR